MLILDWMTSKVISISPETTLLQCRKLFKKHQVRRLPVVDTDGIVVGLISMSDLKAFTPQRSTPLEIIEALDILEEMKARDVMTMAPTTIPHQSTVDQAALVMIEKHLNCLPVVDSDDKLMGILTEWDLFKALTTISGAGQRGVDTAFILENKRGTLREILDWLKEDQMRIISVLSTFTEAGDRQVKVRFYSEDIEGEIKALERLKAHPGLRYWARDGEVNLNKKMQ